MKADVSMVKLDEESGVVIMNKSDYKNEMESILSDERKFMADVDSDGLCKLERKINSNLMKLPKINAVNKKEFNLLEPLRFAVS